MERKGLAQSAVRAAERMAVYGFLVIQEALECSRTLSPGARRRRVS